MPRPPAGSVEVRALEPAGAEPLDALPRALWANDPPMPYTARGWMDGRCAARSSP